MAGSRSFLRLAVWTFHEAIKRLMQQQLLLAHLGVTPRCVNLRIRYLATLKTVRLSEQEGVTRQACSDGLQKG
jgi:hypothetical protein